MGKHHFYELFKDDGRTSIVDQLKVINLFPSFVQDQEKERFILPISLSEVEVVLRAFKKDKSPGPDGWPVEFFLTFFDVVVEELCSVAEQARIEGKVTRAINSTFLTLIPKCDKPTSFADFRPISLCNMVYKIISKVTSLRLKPILNPTISTQQFRFLKDRHITNLLELHRRLSIL